ncbi:hypothetical protein [Streptomyces sp. x-80]|uniref:hypothetical protein n=1 Tax=Streptomyces sp. x-80 TaxID=2789282 RepID=UPI00397FB6C3
MGTGNLTKRVRSALPPDGFPAAVFTVHHLLDGSEGGGDAPKELRPQVLVGHHMRGDGWAHALSFIPFAFKVVLNEFPSPSAGSDDPAVRVQRQKQNSKFFGSWDSLAGKLMAAAQPRCSGGVTTTFALSGDQARFVYWQRRRWGAKLGDAHELGESFRRDSIAWTRRRSKNLGEFQFGFDDGSWGTLLTPDSDAFVEQFPHTLTHKDPIP